MQCVNLRVKFPVYILFLFLICSCHEPGEMTAKIPGEKNTFQPDSAKQRLLKIIEGGWVNENYIAAFERLHSPMAVAAQSLFLQQMTFDISSLSGDTLLNAHGRLKYNEQDRFDVIFFKRTDGKTGMKLTESRDTIRENYELDYTVEGADTILLVKMRGVKLTRTARFKRQFRKFSVSDEVAVTAMELYVNKTLFAGEWNLDGEKISFTEKGGTKNYKSYHRFSVSTLDDEAASSPDKISFYGDTSGVTYVFTVKDEKIQLYELHESAGGKEFFRGKMIGELRRE
jgi:hypothetical protein